MKQLTLGEFISKLKECSKDYKEQEKTIRFDFCNFEPNGIDSYRGYYDQLALGYKENSFQQELKISQVLEYCEKAIGKTFTGWKGGEYVMDEDTPLWVANSGETGSTAIVGVIDSYEVIIQTAFIDN